MTDNEIAIEVINGAVGVLWDNKWTRHAYARDKNNNSISVDSGYCVSFCATGAIDRYCYVNSTLLASDRGPAIRKLNDYVAKSNTSLDLVSYNDFEAKSKRNVISTMKKCVKELEKE